MPRFIITGGNKLNGNVRINGAKNSILPILAASILADGPSTIDEVADLNDVRVMCDILSSLGADTQKAYDYSSIIIDPRGINVSSTPYELVNKMRASFLVLGPMIAKFGRARISLPGGCAIGLRPVDLHIKGFTAMGAEIIQEHGYIEAVAKKLSGAKIYLDFPSVGATENILMAATLAEGQTIIENAAVEPEIVDLANYLIAMGADIKGAGTDNIRVNGVKTLKGVTHSVIPDRIEASTYMIAAAITGGEVTLDNVEPDHLKPVTAKLKEIGAEISEEISTITVKGPDKPKAVDVKTLPYPGYPTDAQAQITALMSLCDGTSIIIETVFENRFAYVSELKRMGASIKIEGRSAVVEGCDNLTGAKVKTTDLRAGAALVVAGLAAKGQTEVLDIDHIERGYFRMDEKLKALGADIIRIDDTEMA